MKKKILSVALSVFAAFSLVGCGSSSDGESANTQSKAGMLERICVNDFESTTDYSPLRVDGIVRVYKTLNGQKKMGGKTEETGVQAFEGAGCAEVLLKKEDDRVVSPMVYQPFNLEAKEDYSDFSYVSKISFCIYNAQEEQENVNLKFSFAGGATVFKQYSLQPKQWNEIVYENYREYMPNVMCEGVWFMFGGSDEHDSRFYMDDIALYKTQKGYNVVTMELDEHEVCSFDKVYQTKFVSVMTAATKASLAPTMSASSFTKTGKGASLYVEAPAGEELWQTSNNWPGIELYSPMLKLVNWADYDENDKLCFDVYSPVENGMDQIWFNLYNSAGTRVWKKDGSSLPKGKWVTLSYTVGEISKTYGKQDSFDDLSHIRILWGEFLGADRAFYVDNFRMEITPNS